MNKFWKGLGVCTFLCMMTAAPSWADICFLPTGTCEQGSQAKVAEAKGCDEYLDIYYAEEQPGMDCHPANVAGCNLWSCTGLDCEDQGYKSGTSNSADVYPKSFPKSMFDCEYCENDGTYYWKCEAKKCLEGYYTKRECDPGYVWVAKEEGGMSGRLSCGQCEIETCDEGTMSAEEIPTDGCFTCTSVQNLETGKICYTCTEMSSESGKYLSAADWEEMDQSCYTFSSMQSANGETCYLPNPLECPLNQYVAHEALENGKTKCTCQDYEYEFTATGEDVIDDEPLTSDGHNTRESKILHYTAAGGVKKVNVKSTQIGEETKVWPYDAPETSGDCTVSKSSDGALLKVTCPVNLTTTEKTSKFTITQTEEDKATTHTIDIKIIIDPDTCDNPNDVVASCSNELGRAPYEKGPRPACYKTHLEASCNLDGYAPIDSGHKSVAGQACYYCIKDVCPDGYEKGQTPTPADGYMTEQTDVGNNCYKEKPCPEGYSTDYPNIDACTANGHPEGWSYTSNGMCGTKPCGKCTPNKCTGEGKDVQCQLTPFCDPAQPGCGYKDPSTEYEGDTPKYNANIKPCPDGTSTTQKQGCGTNVDSGFRSGTEICWKYNEPDRNCSNGFTYNEATCSCVCNRTCGDNEDLDETTCTCKEKPFVCPIGNNGEQGPGTMGAACTEDSQCQATSDFSLICVNKDEHGCGECRECGVYEHNGSIKRGLEVCKLKGIRDKGYKWHYIEATSGQACDFKIGDHCMVKDPTQKYNSLYDGGQKLKNGSILDSSESKNCQNSDGSCKAGCYPDVDHNNQNDPYRFQRCQRPYEGQETWACTTWGECIWEPKNSASWTCNSDGVCWE